MIQLTLSDIQQKTEDVCFKCGKSEVKLIHHHIKYNPEVLVLCCYSCHGKIHKKIRKHNLCPMSVEETAKISNKLRRHRPDYKKYKKLYSKEHHEEYDKRPEIKEHLREYNKARYQRPDIKQRSKEYYQLHKEKIRERNQTPEGRKRNRESKRICAQRKKESQPTQIP